MSDSTTYIIVTAESLETLATAVEAKKQDGYIVSGAPYVVITGYAQDMTLASALSPIDFPDAVVDITGAYIGSRTKESGHPIYYVGDKVEPEEYDATLTLKSGATRPLFQDDFYVSPREISSTSDTTVKVIYKWEKGFEDEVTIAPKAVALTSIVIQDMPRKTTYVVGQTFTGYDGLEVTALYNNNSLKRLPAGSYTVTGNVNTSTAGTNTVTVSYTEGSITKTVTFSIEVVVNIPVALEVLGDAKLQYVGKTIDASGLTFKTTMLDGSVKDVTSSVTSDTTGALTDIGTKKVTFSYTENGVTASVVKYFNVTTMKPVALTMTGEFATQYINTAVNLTGLTFKVVYDNGDVADVTDDVTHTPSTWGSTVGIQTVVFTYTASGVTLTLTKSVEVQEAQQGPNYLKYSSEDPFFFYLSDSNGSWESEKSWNGEMQYATGNEPDEDDWHTLEYNETYSAVAVKSDVAADDGRYNIYLRAEPGSPNTHILTTECGTKTKFMTDSALGPGFFLNVVVSGNIMALFNSTDPNSATLPTDTYALSGMFEGDSNIVDASGLVLPSDLSDPYGIWGCLRGMFYGCTSLTTAPALPATILASDCYVLMFYGCTSLTTAPELPATTLASGCYSSMFEDCTGLATAPVLPATTLASGCYLGMFSGCTALTAAPELPATTLAESCYEDMFRDCTSLTTAPALPAVTPADSCCKEMFLRCTALATLPIIHLEGSGNSACQQMFANCSEIELSATQIGDYQTEYPIPNLTGEDALSEMFADTGGSFWFPGTPTAGTTYYTSNTVVPPAPPSSKLPVGGTIFYEDETAGGVYKLYDENLAETTTLSEAKYYEVITPGTKDKYYVYDSTTGVVDSKSWGYNNITTGATTDTIGSGKTNTNAILAIEDTSGYYSGSIWEYLANTQNAGSGVAGYKDWFVGSKAEQDKLRESKLVTFYTDKDLWSSVESSGSFAYRWGRESKSWYYKSKYSSFSVFFMRTF